MRPREWKYHLITIEYKLFKLGENAGKFHWFSFCLFIKMVTGLMIIISLISWLRCLYNKQQTQTKMNFIIQNLIQKQALFGVFVLLCFIPILGERKKEKETAKFVRRRQSRQAWVHYGQRSIFTRSWNDSFKSWLW